ncbi:hypothetical protein [Bradyrhizobium sp.]
MDRRAARIVISLDLIEDDADLHVTIFHLIEGLKKRGLLKRAMAQEELFDSDKIDGGALSAAETAIGKKPRKRKGASGDDISEAMGGNVTSIGDAARKVTETAGGFGAA